MRILGIDTSTTTGGVAIVDDNRVLANYQLTLDSSHSLRLFPAIHRVLDDVKLSISDLDGIAVTQGPGSFTGLRVGVMAAKTLAHLQKIKLVGVSALEALAYPLRFSNTTICPILDALRGDIYGAIYNCRLEKSQTRDGMQCILDDGVFSLPNFLNIVKEHDSLILFVGNGITKYRNEIEKEFKDKTLFPSSYFQSISPAVVAELGLEKLKLGKDILQDPLSFQPTYLRKPEAEVVYEKKLKI